MNAFARVAASCISPALYAEATGFNLDRARQWCGEIGILRCTHEAGLWRLDDTEGEESAFMGVASAAGEPVDVVCWPLRDPNVVSLAYGNGVILGEENICSAASWAFGGMLEVWRSPLRWLQADCRGIVVLNFERAGPLLRRALGPLLCEEQQLALDLEAVLNPPKFPFKILAPRGSP